MDFELKHMEMIQAETQTRDNTRAIGSSQVLEELNQQVEELQNKLKVSYRKLLLYESENQKLIQEKNAFFFENKVFAEHNAILLEKNRTLQSTHDDMMATIEKKSHKIEIAEKLIETQKSDLSRLSKFHEKVKNIIKPFVQNLKEQNAALTEETQIKSRTISQYETFQSELTTRIENLEDLLATEKRKYSEEKTAIVQNFTNEKTAIIQSYEEQIHFLSKEIVEEQQRALEAQNENLRLKKQCETKHFVENELVKYKRLQDENLQTVNSLRLKENELQRQLTETQVAESTAKNQITGLAAELESSKELLDATRRQLSLKITEVEDMTLRLKMLEKLNSNLSLNLKDYQT